MKCVDASFCFDYLKGEVGAVRRGQEFEQNRTELLISSPALMEVLLEGYRKGGKTLEKVLALVGRLEVIPVDSSIAHEAARLGADCIKRGSTVPNTDLLIAACARVHHLPLVTRDSDFNRIPGLALETY